MADHKVSIVGAGNVGSTLAFLLAIKDIADVALIDVVEGLSEGKALDISHAKATEGFSVDVVGSSDYSIMDGSSVVVVTAGVPRKPGMTREDLLDINRGIISDVAEKIVKFSPDAVVIVVTNPLDAMCYFMMKKTGFPKERVVGMAGVLDGSRLAHVVSEKLSVHPSQVFPSVFGTHGETMVPLPRFTSVFGVPLSQLMGEDDLNEVEVEVKGSGAKVVSLLKKGSAYFAPASSVCLMVKSILKDEKRVLYCSAYLSGEYGFSDVFLGVPVVLGRSGVERILELPLEGDEMERLRAAYRSVRSMVEGS